MYMKILLGRSVLGYCTLPYQTVARWVWAFKCRKVLTADVHHSGLCVFTKWPYLNSAWMKGGTGLKGLAAANARFSGFTVLQIL